jgi:tRNA pseudouridine55 synthase
MLISMSFDGILLIDKPREWSSFDVVAKVRNTLRKEAGHKVKVGHTGTLDPLATGLLVIVIGSYCKRAAEFSKLDKTYEVTMKLGETSSTGDEEGEKTVISDHQPSEIEVKEAINSFVGEILQTPPAYSAIKINGQRAYKLARAGKEVVIEPRKVTIYGITDVKYSYPTVTFTAKVSSGTYIRSLVQDIGTMLTTGAYMSALRRTNVAQFSIEDTTPIADVSIDKILTI